MEWSPGNLHFQQVSLLSTTFGDCGCAVYSSLRPSCGQVLPLVLFSFLATWKTNAPKPLPLGGTIGNMGRVTGVTSRLRQHHSRLVACHCPSLLMASVELCLEMAELPDANSRTAAIGGELCGTEGNFCIWGLISSSSKRLFCCI